ncbi:MAG TPA: peptidyl-prolyl cis-trans isomerase [Anaeromyxobacteraceae bacterium]|nr:peptidyl-prolyl cis-trans isomerase [Anaeromyxobacteraceae bacterium]
MLPVLLLAALSASPAGEAVATVNDRTVTSADLQARRDAPRPHGQPAPARPALLRDAIDAALLEADGYAAGLARDPEVAGQVDAARRRAAAERLVREEIAPAAAPSEAQLLELFHAGADEVDLELVALAGEEAARAARARLERGGSLAEEARASLQPESQRSGGRLAPKRRAELPPALAAAAFSAPLGSWSGPVALSPGHAVFRVVARRIADEKGFPDRREQLRAFARKQGTEQARAHALRQLRAREKVALDEAFLLSTAGRVEGSPAEMEQAVAVVGGRAIRYRDVAAELTRLFGGRTGVHGMGGKLKVDLAWLLVDQALLEKEALARGHGDAPEAKAAAALAERRAVAALQARRLGPALADRLAELRRTARIRIDEAALARALPE